ncbi:alpha/beta fold hydrolase [Gordonia sp. HY285]|uniref:Alpha/beta fold hydrolase n=1 Tax=Gordonia liuliyuniae TaxID=2911517 RepID=A0ABS9IWU2_9ACTN|nr:alpha/beta fold hydrolase [Gordonia liuliyuniae]MCF8590041.1 alpha/beta fold hydrolase [Gordonia liuliyuniae]MCF8610335.1 alpha/beta fold hydrolase [Gordonia liuliyuniae]
MTTSLRRLAVAALAVAGVLAFTTFPATAQTRFQLPAPSMAQVNDWGCKPDSPHPAPLVLVHGTAADKQDWADYAPLLVKLGYCVFAPDYGGHPVTGGQVKGFGDVRASARHVADFIANVKARTGAKKVTYVGHSQGAMIGEYYAKYLGGASTVDSMILLAPLTHGTTLSGLNRLVPAGTPNRATTDAAMGVFCPACVDMEEGSAFVRKLTRGPIAQPGIEYFVIASRNDLIVTPPKSQFIREPGVDNVFVQEVCPRAHVGHQDLTHDRVVAQLLLARLGHHGTSSIAC